MNPLTYARVREVFLQVLDTPAAQRAAVIETGCGGDPVLASEVLSLLAQHEAGGPSFDLAQVVPELAGMAAPRVLPERIGDFRILGVLGEGGMGIVFRAEQDNPRRTVALKVVRPGFTTPRTLRRFELEAAVLGRLQHPGIAQIHAAGHADTGAGPQPYFAMELVTGVPLTVYATQQRLDVRARLALLADVAEAVHHAHQKGVVHCDLKPANVLVDANGRPKVLDFGVARVTDQDLHANSLRPGDGQLVGTLAYMSPEQALGDPEHIDIRADVYSLGVIGYELLAGVLPLDLVGRRLVEAVDMLRTQAPVPLGVRVRALRGDVSTIVERAMAKDREQRYQAASALVADLRRWLRHEPIQARPASVWYHLRKFAQRHRGLVAGAAAAFVALLAGVVGTGVSLVHARAAEAKASASLTQALAAERDAQAKRELADKTSEFLERTIQAIDPNRAGNEVKLGDVLRKAARDVETTFAGEPLAQARVHTTLGETFRGLGMFIDAERELAAAYEIRFRLLGPDDADTRAARSHLAMALQGLGRFAEAAAHYREILAQDEALPGPEHADTLNARHNLAEILDDLGDQVTAEAMYRELVAVRTRIHGEDDLETMASVNNLASILQNQGRVAECEGMLRRIVDVRTRVQGPDHPDRLVALNNLGSNLLSQERIDEAEPLLREAVAGMNKVVGPLHHETLSSRTNLAQVLRRRGRTDEAVAELRAVRDGRADVLGADHIDTLRASVHLALVLIQSGGREEGSALVDLVQARWRAGDYGESNDALTMLHLLSKALTALGRLEPAATVMTDVVRIQRARLGEHHAETLTAVSDLAQVQHALGRVDDARQTQAAALAGFRATLGPGNPTTLSAMYSLAFLHLRTGDAAAALPLLRECLPLLQQNVGALEVRTLTAQATLARCLQLTGDASTAAGLFEELDDCLAEVDWPPGQASLLGLGRIGRLLLDSGRYAAALPLFDRLLAMAAAAPQFAGREAGAFARNRAECLAGLGRIDEAEHALLVLRQAAEEPGSATAGERPSILRSLLAVYERTQQADLAAAIKAELATAGDGRRQ
ncbi:MAG: tetratricopeptide repeat protein [Planctomycetota bacterium]